MQLRRAKVCLLTLHKGLLVRPRNNGDRQSDSPQQERSPRQPRQLSEGPLWPDLLSERRKSISRGRLSSVMAQCEQAQEAHRVHPVERLAKFLASDWRSSLDVQPSQD